MLYEPIVFIVLSEIPVIITISSVFIWGIFGRGIQASCIIESEASVSKSKYLKLPFWSENFKTGISFIALKVKIL